jgi:glucan phosphoethanolaminetransferase (alkaline phosphatase superfamily)
MKTGEGSGTADRFFKLDERVSASGTVIECYPADMFTKAAERPVSASIEKKSSLRLFAALLSSALITANDVRLLEVLENVTVVGAISYAACFILFIPLLLNRNAFTARFTQILVFSAFFTDIVYLLLGRYPFSYPDAINLFNNPEYASGAIVTFKTAFLVAFAGATALFVLLRYSLGHQKTWTASPLWAIGFLSIQAFLFLAANQKPGLPDYLPSVYRLTGNLITAERSVPETHWNRQPVTITPTGKQVRHIFLIVDESVSAKALSINGASYATTPFMLNHKSSFINFGEAVSTTNFSAGSNFAFMTGLTPEQLPDLTYRSFTEPSIYQYAQKAGYKTFLLDAQTTGDNLQNYLTEKDLESIDTTYKPANAFPTDPIFHHDARLAEKIVAISKLDHPTFTYINKAGAHWPYQSNAPISKDTCLGRGTTGAYNISLKWNLDRFWQKIMTDPQPDSNSLFIYTSDHGENYASPSTRVKHASIYRADTTEGLVPLLVLDKSGFFSADFTPSKARYSHQLIFPTVLTAMGYNTATIKGPTLRDPLSSSAPFFLCGDIFGRGTNTRIIVR